MSKYLISEYVFQGGELFVLVVMGWNLCIANILTWNCNSFCSFPINLLDNEDPFKTVSEGKSIYMTKYLKDRD